MKNLTVSITDLQHRRIRIWAAQRNCSISFIVRRVLEDLPRLARALQAVNSYELQKMGYPATPENQALVDFLKPVPRNKKLSQFTRAKQNLRKQPTQNQPDTWKTPQTEDSASARGTVPVVPLKTQPQPRMPQSPRPIVVDWETANLAPSGRARP